MVYADNRQKTVTVSKTILDLLMKTEVFMAISEEGGFEEGFEDVLLIAPEPAIISYFFETEEGFAILEKVEGYILDITGLACIDFDSFGDVLAYVWSISLHLSKEWKMDPYDLFEKKRLWELLIESGAIPIVVMGEEDDS